MPQKRKVQWWVNVRRYRGRDGRFVSQRSVNKYIGDTVDAFAASLRKRSEALVAGFSEEAFGAWALKFKQEVRAMHNAVTVIALGGKKASLRFASENAQVWQDAELAIAQQMRHLDRFMLAVVSGAQPLDGRFVARAEMYGQAGYLAYQNAVRMRESIAGSYDEERRLLHSGHPCGTCTQQAALGWQPKGVLRRLGDSECVSRCRCTFEYRKAPVEE